MQCHIMLFLMEKSIIYSRRSVTRTAWARDICILEFKAEFRLFCGWTKEPEQASEINNRALDKITKIINH